MKKLYMFILMFVFFISSVYALQYRTGQYYYFNFSSNAKDELGHQDFTACAASPTFSPTLGADFEASSSQCLYFAGQTEVLTASSKSWSFCGLIHIENLTSTMIVYDEHQDSSGKGFILRILDSGGGIYKYNFWHDATATSVGSQLQTDTDYKTCVTYNSTNTQLRLYVNSNSSTAVTNSVTDGTGTLNVYMARYAHIASTYYDGRVKEWCGWRNTTSGRILTAQEVTTYMNYGCEGSTPAPPQPASTPSLLVNTDMSDNFNYHLFNLTIHYNGTIMNSTKEIFNCTLSKYDYDNASYTHQYDLNVNLSINQNFFENYGAVQQALYYYDITCVNGNLTNTSATHYYNIDTVQPYISTGFVNHSTFYHNLHTEIPFEAFFNDTNLYATNVTICAWNGSICTSKPVYSHFVNGSIYGSSRSDNIYIPLANFTTTDYMYRVQAWDSHTKKEIKEYQTTKLRNGYSFENNAVIITSDDLNSMNITKHKDRYTFDMDFKKKNPMINVECSDLRYIYNSTYKSHLVCWDNKKWIDFDTDSNVEMTVIRVNKNKVVVVPAGNKKSFKFKSIGDLNYNYLMYYFNVTYGTKFVVQDGFTGANIQNYNLTIYTYPSTVVQTRGTTTYNLTTNVTGIYYFNISSSGYVTNVTVNYTFLPNVTKVVKIFATNSLYLFIYDEQTNTLITDRPVTVDVINYANISHEYNTSTGILFQSGFAAGDYEINYYAENYTARSYYTTVVGSDTQSIDLYLLTNLISTHQYLNYAIVDNSAVWLSNATLSMQRYFLQENAWKTVEMSRSNDAGKGFVFAELYDAAYRFMIDYQDSTVKITSPTKLDTRDLLFNINLLDSGLTHYYLSGDVATSIVFDNTTKVWTFNYNAAGFSDVENGRFLVTKVTPQVRTTICNTTLSADNGGITCNLTAYTTDTADFMAQGFVSFTGNNTEYLVGSDSYSFNNNYMKYGLTGVLLGFMIVGTMAFIGLYSPIIAVVMGVFGFAITSVLGLLTISYTWLIGIAVVGLLYIYSMRQA